MKWCIWPSLRLAEDHHWIEEGSATYMSRSRGLGAGDLTPEKVWGDLVDGCRRVCRPREIAASISRRHGVEPTGVERFFACWPTSRFETHRKSQGLEDALRAVLAAGGQIETEWPLTKHCGSVTMDRRSSADRVYEKMKRRVSG